MISFRTWVNGERWSGCLLEDGRRSLHVGDVDGPLERVPVILVDFSEEVAIRVVRIHTKPGALR